MSSRPSSSDEGLTLVELLIASSLLLLAILMFSGALLISQRTQIRDAEYSAANDAAHLAIAEIDRQVRSGYVIATPPSVSGTADGVKIFTMTNGQARCALWVVAPPAVATEPMLAQGLYMKTWNPATQTQPTAFGAAGGWRLVAGDLVGADSSTFTIDTANVASDVFPTMEMVLHLNASRDKRQLQEIEIRSQFASRNSPRALDPYGATNSTAGAACG